MRFITSGDTGILRPFEPPKEGTRILKKLKELELPEFLQPDEIPENVVEEPKYTLAEMAQFGIEAARARQDQIDAAADQMVVPDEEAMITELPMGAVVDEGNQTISLVSSPGASQFQLSPEEVKKVKLALSAAPPDELPQIGEVAPAKVIAPPNPNLPPTIAVEKANNPVFVVQTDDASMAQEGPH
jgi:hypothetical protein